MVVLAHPDLLSIIVIILSQIYSSKYSNLLKASNILKTVDILALTKRCILSTNAFLKLFSQN